MLNWDEIFSAQSWARERVEVYELVASVLESFQYLSFIRGTAVESDTRHIDPILKDSLRIEEFPLHSS